jgi:hypothetical protein
MSFRIGENGMEWETEPAAQSREDMLDSESRMTLQRAAGALEVSTNQKLVDGINRWFWSLPQSLQSGRTAHHAQQGSVASSVVSETKTAQALTPNRPVDSVCATGVCHRDAPQGDIAPQGLDKSPRSEPPVQPVTL